MGPGTVGRHVWTDARPGPSPSVASISHLSHTREVDNLCGGQARSMWLSSGRAGRGGGETVTRMLRARDVRLTAELGCIGVVYADCCIPSPLPHRFGPSCIHRIEDRAHVIHRHVTSHPLKA
eukprot:7151502-Prymnesium_polylepis.2